MADQYLQQLTEDTAPVASNFIPSSDSGTGRLKKLKNSRFIYEYQNSTPSSNVTGEVGVLDILTMTSMSSDIDYTLPATAAVGERCGVSIIDGDDTYGVLIKSGGSGDKINNVDHSSTEFATLINAGEFVTFRCIDAAGPHWQIEDDERIIKNNLSALAAPTSSDDRSLGYVVGSQWAYNNLIYICGNNTTGAAVWNLLSTAGTTATVSTTDGTETTCGTVATSSDTAYFVKALIIGRNTTDSSQSFGYVRTGTFLNDGGTLTLVGAVTTDHDGESAVGGDATLDVSGTDIRCRVTGLAATDIDWLVSLDVIEI